MRQAPDYTPTRVLQGLEIWPYLRMRLSTPERLPVRQQPRVSAGSSLEDQICELVDLESALLDLPDRPFVAICMLTIFRMEPADIADELRMPQKDVGPLCSEAAKAMAESLGWQPRRGGVE